jgi:hypothetical protein
MSQNYGYSTNLFYNRFFCCDLLLRVGENQAILEKKARETAPTPPSEN